MSKEASRAPEDTYLPTSRRGGICTCCCTPHTPVLPCGGGLWSLRGQVAAGGGGGGSSPPRGGGCPSFRHSRGPAQAPGEGDLKHTSDCPRCMVHYETCIQSLMAQVQDLRAKGLELQQSQQELSEAVGSTAGISKSYGDRMTQVPSTLAKSDAVVQGYQRDSRAVAASEADHLKMSDSNMAKCFSAVETLATRYAAVASRIDAWDQGYATPAEPVKVVPPPSSAPPSVPDPQPAAPSAPMGAPSSSSFGGCVLTFSVHPSHDCIYHLNACPHSAWPRGGLEHHKHSHHQEPTSWRGTSGKQKGPAVFEWKGGTEERRIPLGAYGPVDRCGGELLFIGKHQSPDKKCFHFPWETFVHAFSCYGHTYSFSSEGCTNCKSRCTPNHGSPLLPHIPNTDGAR